MVKHTTLIFWLILGGICIFISCNSLNFNKSPATGSPVTAPPPSDTVSIEIFNIHLAPYQNELLQRLWQEVDEQSLPPQLRRELLAQGFRAGILGNLISPALAQLLKVSSEGKSDASWGNFQEISAADVMRETTTTRSVRSLSPDMRALVKIFDDQNALPECALFWQENGMFTGQTYTDAIGVLCIRATVNKDGYAQIQITPELEYGVMERRIRTVLGMVVQEESRPRRAFDTLTISQRLLPGQWIIMGVTTPDAAGVGKAFFVRKEPALEQRLLAIRLIHATPAAPVVPSSPFSKETVSGSP